MINLIKKYYQAWETKDINLLKEVVHSSIYGVRTYQEDKLFTNDELYTTFNNSTINKVEVIKTDIIEDAVKLLLTINNQSVAAKIKIKDNKIYKVYEEIPNSARRIKCVCAYDGSSYSGYQKQQNASSIQETIETAITKAFKLDNQVRIHSSGRTDKGVHAINQVFHFDLDTQIKIDKIPMILNSYLPSSILIKSCDDVDHTFHSRYDVKEKEYIYKININEYNPIQRNYEWFIKDFDLHKFNEQLNKIVGEHDFTSFTKANKNHSNIRTIFKTYTDVQGNYVYVHIKGNGFLRYMVRNIVGAIIAINQGKLNYSITELLELKDVNLIKDKAPANGLYLYDVKY